MSAFIVADGTMDRVVTAISVMRENLGRGSFGGIPLASDKAEDRIGQALYAMNQRAIVARYGAEDVTPLYRWQPCYPGRHESPECLAGWYKSLSCLLYQCSEGDVPECDLFKELGRVRDQVAHALIRTVPAYDKAPWDVDRRDPRHQAA